MSTCPLQEGDVGYKFNFAVFEQRAVYFSRAPAAGLYKGLKIFEEGIL